MPVEGKEAVSGTFIAQRVGSLLDAIGEWLGNERFDGVIDRLATFGHWSLLGVAVVGLLIQIVVAVVAEPSAVVWGIVWLLVLPLLQYTVMQFMGATRSLVTSTPSTLGSRAFLRAYALVALVVALVAFVGGIVWSIEAGSIQIFLFGLVVAALAIGTVWLALQPSLLALKIDERISAGEEALGLLSFFAKAGVRLVPIFYGVALVVAFVYGVILLLSMIGSSQAEIVQAVARAEMTVPLVLWAALSPFLAYIAFVFYFLGIDLMRSILAIPSAMSAGAPSGGGTRTSRKKSASKKSASKKKSSGSASTGSRTSTGSGDESPGSSGAG